MKTIGLDGFEAKFAADADPWRTWSNRDEAVKRRAILHALGPEPIGRVLEWGAGNGSNSRAIAMRSRSLDATEATNAGTQLVAQAITGIRGARATRLVVPARPPQPRYDAIVIAELLYYLSPRDMAALARQTALLLRPGGTLVLAHHRITFYDFAQHAAGIGDRFLRETGRDFRTRVVARTAAWSVTSHILTARGGPG